jgi:uncharacterized protein YyaL (SSP411 family)
MNMDFQKNNLAKASSPYLKQHAKNPIWWQEWTPDVLEHAKKKNRILFVSVGYSTCHWCHVMASEAFSNKKIADYLNKHFVCIKVDREQRPDIDRHMMDFIVQLSGQGGWPLNVFLSPELTPFYAITYAPVEERYGMPGFLDVLKKLKKFYVENGDNLIEFKAQEYEMRNLKENKLIDLMWNGFDKEYAGFGTNTKFPAHSTLLFMLHYISEQQTQLKNVQLPIQKRAILTDQKRLRKMLESTLDYMLLRGLHDHLQGGFFRYCVERRWSTPHFEKMLYDQAMLLWVYSLGFRVLGKEEYKKAGEKIIDCLAQTYQQGSLFFSAHDADTDHVEGATYLWDYNEIKKLLSKDEFEKFKKVYEITEQGNIEGKNHLIKKENVFLVEIEKKLLKARAKRKQPFTDKKIVTSWNCLLGIAFINSYRYLGIKDSMKKAKGIFKELMKTHYVKGKLYHSLVENKEQVGEFLEDYASMLLLITYLHEDEGGLIKQLKEFSRKLDSFRKEDKWVEANNADFKEINAGVFDSPVPSSVSLAEFSLLRAKIYLGKEYKGDEFRSSLSHDFYNIQVMLRNGLFHIYETPKKIGWADIPLNSMQLYGKKSTECYKGVCKEFKV